MHTGLAPRWAPMGAIKEILHGLRKIAQCLLLSGLTAGTKPRILGSSFRQLPALLDIAGSASARLPMLLLLHRQIPHKSGISAIRQHCLLLLSVGQQSKPRHFRTVTTTTDIYAHSPSVPFEIGRLRGLKLEITSRGRRR